MIPVAYAGSSFNQVLTLRVPVSAALTLQQNMAAEWASPVIVRLLDPSRDVVWLEDFISAPVVERVVGDNVEFDYQVSFAVPTTIASGLYQITLTRYLISASFQVQVEASDLDVAGGDDIVCHERDTIRLRMLDTNDADVRWAFSFTDVLGNARDVSGLTVKTPINGGFLYESDNPLNAAVEGFSASLLPMTIRWTIESGPKVLQRMSSVYVFTDSMLAAVSEVEKFLERVHQDARLTSLEWTIADYARWLSRGADMFNAQSQITGFTMTNAQGPIRHWWLTCATIFALREKYLAEGVRSFQFSGQSVSLDVDLTQYFQGLADTLMGEWTSVADSLKRQLRAQGLVSGSGAMTGHFQAGVVGLTLGPQTSFSSLWAYRGLYRFF